MNINYTTAGEAIFDFIYIDTIMFYIVHYVDVVPTFYNFGGGNGRWMTWIFIDYGRVRNIRTGQLGYKKWHSIMRCRKTKYIASF